MLLALAFSSTTPPAPQLPPSPPMEPSTLFIAQPQPHAPQPVAERMDSGAEVEEPDVMGAAEVLAGLRECGNVRLVGAEHQGNRGAWKGGMDVFLGPPTSTECCPPAASCPPGPSATCCPPGPSTAPALPTCTPKPPHPSACCPPKNRPSAQTEEEDPYACAQTIPCFTLRDKILKYGKEIDLSALCNELVERAVCHGDPWDPKSWELPGDLFERFPMMR